jgi:hypothetical protein
MTDTIEQQLAAANARIAQLAQENADLAALLPPALRPGLFFRLGNCQPGNVYVEEPGVDGGYLLGKIPTPEWAAHVVRALNTVQFDKGSAAAELIVKAAELRTFAKQVDDGASMVPMPPSIIASMAREKAEDYEHEAAEQASAALTGIPGPSTPGVLNVPMGDNDSGADTIRGYLVALAAEVWRIGEGFSGKRPFGNSGWRSDLYIPLVKAGLISGAFDSDGYLKICDEDEGDRLINGAIAELGVAR